MRLGTVACFALLAARLFVLQAQPSTRAPGMVIVPAGVYKPLFRTELDPKEISIPAFQLDVLPVTNADFLAFVTANPKWRRSQVKPLFADTNYLAHWSADLDPGPKAPASAPVTYVSWHAARACAAWLGKRLPTTAEWEYAAEASATRPDGQNDPAFRAELLRWFSTPSPALLPPVGQRCPNFHGLHDLHGLVFEWPSDFNNFLVTGESRGDTSLERNLFCGSGSQGVKDASNYPAFMRYAFRSSLQSRYTVHNLGFRCAKNL